MALIKDKTYYTYRDVTIVPSVISPIEHRNECVQLDENGMLPLFTAPMDTVIGVDNYDKYIDEMINAILPRTVDINTRIEYSSKGRWAAYSLNEFDIYFCDIKNKIEPSNNKIRILIDVANGHMKKIFDLVRKCRNVYGDTAEIMVGNIANHETYLEYAKVGVDFIRCGIGSGCFVGTTKITLSDGSEKEIKDVNVNDFVLTKNGNFKVVGVKKTNTNCIININNEVKCTPNHKFLVIDKKDKELVTEENLDDYSYYVEASELDKNKHFLIKLFKFIDIESIEIINTDTEVYDIEVDEEHSYIANGYVVHNCGCLSTSNTGIHVPMASLIDDISSAKKDVVQWIKECSESGTRCIYNRAPKIVADGGIRNYSDIIKAIALGADYVMVGSIFSKMIESSGVKVSPFGVFDYKRYKSLECRDGKEWYGIEYVESELNGDIQQKIGQIEVVFYGMASREGQIALNGSKTKTSEGLKVSLPCEYTMHQWTRNFVDYLRSAMSYVGAKTLDEFRENAKVIVNSNNAVNVVNK